MDVHERVRIKIQDFLQKQAVIPLVSGAPALPDEQCTKAGVIPFVRGQETEQGTTLYFMMKPVAARAELSAPDFQIGKGTRMQRVDGRWQDMRGSTPQKGEREPLVVTALREGIEEVGLKLDSVRQMLDLGPYSFSSSNTGKPRTMWLFAAEMPSVQEVLPAEDIEQTTAERSWLSLSEFMIVGREDHRYILCDVAAKLDAHYHKE